MEKWTEPIWQVWKLFDTLEQNLSSVNAKSVQVWDFLTLHIMEKWTEPIWQVWKLFDTLEQNLS